MTPPWSLTVNTLVLPEPRDYFCSLSPKKRRPILPIVVANNEEDVRTSMRFLGWLEPYCSLSLRMMK